MSGKGSTVNLLKAFIVVSVIFQTIYVFSSSGGWNLAAEEDLTTNIPNNVLQVQAVTKTAQETTHRNKYEQIPLQDLVNTVDPPATCPSPTQSVVNNTFLLESITHYNRKIPKIIHMTAKSRCLVPEFKNNIDKWRFADHSFYFHDDAAMYRLLHKHWPEFPHLQLILPCLVSGAATVDLWRYLLLWEYGGIYTDFDNAPGGEFLNGTAILPTDDAWFLQEEGGFLSQFFMVASPRHPLLHLCVTYTLNRIMRQNDVSKLYAPFVTGPGALKDSFRSFMGVSADPAKHQKVPPGFYQGLHNRSVTVKGGRKAYTKYLLRSSVRKKHLLYKEMGMFHFSQSDLAPKMTNESCFNHLYYVSATDYELENDGNKSTPVLP